MLNYSLQKLYFNFINQDFFFNFCYNIVVIVVFLTCCRDNTEEMLQLSLLKCLLKVFLICSYNVLALSSFFYHYFTLILCYSHIKLVLFSHQTCVIFYRNYFLNFFSKFFFSTNFFFKLYFYYFSFVFLLGC